MKTKPQGDHFRHNDKMAKMAFWEAIYCMQYV